MRMVGKKTNWFWGFALTVSLSHDPIAKNSPTGEMGGRSPHFDSSRDREKGRNEWGPFPPNASLNIHIPPLREMLFFVCRKKYSVEERKKRCPRRRRR